MKHNYLLLIELVLLSAVLLTACGKKEILEEETIVYPVAFEMTEIIVKSEIRMITKDNDGPLTDEFYTALVNNSPAFNFENSLSVGETYLTFSQEGEGFLAPPFGGKSIVKKEGGLWLFYSNKEQPIPTLDNNSAYGLISRLPKYRNEPVPAPTPLEPGRHIQKEVWIARGNLTEIRIPIISFYLIRRYGNGFNTIINYLPNEFNEGVIQELKEHDTLFIKEYELVCKAQK